MKRSKEQLSRDNKNKLKVTQKMQMEQLQIYSGFNYEMMKKSDERKRSFLLRA